MTIATCSWTWLRAGPDWLPTWLPQMLLAQLTFHCSNSLAARRGIRGQGDQRRHEWPGLAEDLADLALRRAWRLLRSRQSAAGGGCSAAASGSPITRSPACWSRSPPTSPPGSCSPPGSPRGTALPARLGPQPARPLRYCQPAISVLRLVRACRRARGQSPPSPRRSRPGGRRSSPSPAPASTNARTEQATGSSKTPPASHSASGNLGNQRRRVRLRCNPKRSVSHSDGDQTSNSRSR
jgi:hypothetical protein